MGKPSANTKNQIKKKFKLQGISNEAPLKISAAFGRTAYTFIDKNNEKEKTKNDGEESAIPKILEVLNNLTGDVQNLKNVVKEQDDKMKKQDKKIKEQDDKMKKQDKKIKE